MIRINKILLTVLALFTIKTAFAVCPLCVFAVGAGIGLSQYFGIDDAITGLWIGGLLVSLVVLTKNWFEAKNIIFRGYKVVIVLVYYGSVLLPLYFSSIIGHDLNKLWGVDKIVLGVGLGSLFFLISALVYEKIKKNNGGHAYFPFQKVVMPIATLFILSIVFYYITR